MKGLTLSLVIALIAFTTQTGARAQTGSDPGCIEKGETLNHCEEVDLDGPGMPAGAAIVRGSGRMFERDPLSPNDRMGRVQNATETELCGKIKNVGGRLVGPNGTPQNGGVEGDCIEVYYRFRIVYPVRVCDRVTIGVGSNQVSSEECFTILRSRYRKTPVRSVCPC